MNKAQFKVLFRGQMTSKLILDTALILDHLGLKLPSVATHHHILTADMLSLP